jgi:hypothetical protein
MLNELEGMSATKKFAAVTRSKSSDRLAGSRSDFQIYAPVLRLSTLAGFARRLRHGARSSKAATTPFNYRQ